MFCSVGSTYILQQENFLNFEGWEAASRGRELARVEELDKFLMISTQY